MAKYRFSHDAEFELDAIIETIKQDNPNAAGKWFLDIHKKCRTLGDFPRMGRVRDDLLPDAYMFPFGKYLIFYDIEPKGIVVLHVVDARRDVPNIFPKK